MAPLVSDHGPPPLVYDSSILLPSDTASASSDMLRHHDGPSTSHREPRSSQESYPQATSSDTDTKHPPSPGRRSVVEGSAPRAAVSTSRPLGSGAATDSSHPPPHHPLSSSVRRKSLSSSASSTAAASLNSRDSAGAGLPPPLNADLLPKPEQRFARSPSIDSPTFYDYPHSLRISQAASSCESPVNTGASAAAPADEARNIPASQHQHSISAELPQEEELSVYDRILSRRPESSGLNGDTVKGPTPRNAVDGISSDELQSLFADELDYTTAPPVPTLKPAPLHLNFDSVKSSASPSEAGSFQGLCSPDSTKHTAFSQLNKPLPKSPGQTSPLAALFGWSNTSSSVTDCSSIPSPLSPSKDTNDRLQGSRNSRSVSAYSDSNGATSNPIGYCESYLSTPPPESVTPSVLIEEMEDELKAISAELAASIRREMDLEDLVDRLQEQVSNPQGPSKRSSDYFSDSGYSSAKTSDYDQSREEIDKIQRRSEQEKASIRLELNTKLQDERSRRKALDQQIKGLAEKASRVDLAQINSLDASDRVRELEQSCEDLRRRLSEERESKDNFEDLLSGMKSELQEACNERDNLRDEVVPQLRARVEGLEAQAASYANLTYESTKMQHQLQSLKQENTSLRISMGPEDLALTRSNSIAASSFKARGPPTMAGLSRSASVKNVQSESREALAERLKDVEAQRDALHSALKNLLERQEFQNRENAKKIKILEAERQRLLLEPGKAGFDREIKTLRTEITMLRRRAEEALEQKWQVEKGLGGLKMDLDKAEEEIASLRSLLREKDILIPPSLARSSVATRTGSLAVPVTSESLQKAYKDLQSAYSESLERIKKLELGVGDDTSDDKTKLAIQRLEQSLSSAVSERDAARRYLDGLKTQVDGLSVGESQHVGRETALAEQLSESAQRVENLAAQVQQQLSTNAELRKRLADTVARGDADRKVSSDRITELQARLHVLEEKLVAAQTAAEDRVGRHEEELSQLREAHSEQLRRINEGAGIGVTAPKSGVMLSSGGISSWFGRSKPIPAKTLEEDVDVTTLRARVTELEKALADAENEIQQVVAKMSEAQIEVMSLQEERETAARETRRLQKLLEEAKLTPPGGSA